VVLKGLYSRGHLHLHLLITFLFVPQTDGRGGDDGHRDPLQIDGRGESQLRTELEESQKQLKCAHDTRQEQKNKIQSVRYVAHTK